MRVFFACALLAAARAATFHGQGQGRLRTLRRITGETHAATNEDGVRLSCGVRFHLHSSFMAGHSRDAKEERIVGLTYAANQTFAKGPDFDIHIHEIVHDTELNVGSTTNANVLLTLAEDATQFDHTACANVWMMHIVADNNIVGLAYVGGSCDGACNAEQHIALVTLSPTFYNARSASHFTDEAWVLSHELGHLVGATHIEGDSVMNPGVVSYNTAENGFSWHQSSLVEIETHMAADCTLDTCLTANAEQIEPHITCTNGHCYEHHSGDGIVYLWFLTLLIIPLLLWIL
jgi:hypothetical protein